MNTGSMPFPGKELAQDELSRDSCYHKIRSEDRKRITDRAWQKGEAAAEMIFMRYDGEKDFFRIVSESGLTCEKVDADYVVGNQRYFSDYMTGQKRIHLYLKSISLWAKENKMEMAEAMNLILSHEYYHYLEWSELGFTSKEYLVPMLRIGSLKIGRTGIRALSEIGAHAFACRYEQLIKEERYATELKL